MEKAPKTKNQFLTEAQKKEICDLGEKGLLHKDIAKIVSVSISTVSRVLIEAGISRYYTKRTWRDTHKGWL